MAEERLELGCVSEHLAKIDRASVADEGLAVQPELLLFAALVVRGLAEDAGSAAGAGAATAATGG